ncbi:MAG: PEP-CTERM sorting domain-containing protein, partial [Moorea sp. SIO2I5]|nr:PEP-CTERM sorting domain-containing protein [Moorena sp. SIO2I5]
DPIDAVIDDPLLGDIGTLDGNLDVIPTEVVNTTSSGSTPFVPLITATAGDNVPDLAPTPFEAELPFESLYSAGAIVETPGNPAQADSFFNLFIEIQGTPEGRIRARDPLMLTGLSPLIGFPLGTDQNSINYVSGDITPLFNSGPDGLFWTGDEIEVARLVPDISGQAVTLTLSATSVPEPSTVLSSILIGLTTLLKCHKKSR